MTALFSGLRLSALAVSVAFVLGVAPGVGVPTPAQAANDETTQVLVGASTTIALDGNPSTGHSWVLDAAASDNADLVAVEDLGYDSAPPVPGKRPVLGAPKTQKFQVTGVAEGEAKLKFDYVRAGGSAPAKSVDVVVEVIAAGE